MATLCSLARVRQAGVILLFVAVGMASANATTKEKVIATFDITDGMVPQAGFISDAAGNLYGTTSLGGNAVCADYGGGAGCGTVIELSHSKVGWTETVLYSFQGDGDGISPSGNLVFDGKGNLYGTTEVGGPGNCLNGCGTVFELSPPAEKGGEWTETILYSFKGGDDGHLPEAGLIFDGSGNLYGTTFWGGGSNCGGYGCGTAFELSPPAEPGSPWTETILHHFPGGTSLDASGPSCTLVPDRSGNLYGTTGFGGQLSNGAVFELTPPIKAGGAWTESVIYSFTGVDGDGSSPHAGVTFGPDGALYGTTSGAGASIGGTVFRLAPPAEQGGTWTETVIYSFTLQADGGNPFGGLIFDTKGNLYGTTLVGGDYSCNEGFNDGCGVVFKVVPPKVEGEKWEETALHGFAGGSDGMEPSGQLILGKAGLLYGMTESGGTSNAGIVFSVVP